MLGIVGWSLVISMVINGLMFLVAYARRSDKLTDASYAVTFIALALRAYFHSRQSTYDVVGALMVCLWALRIGSFLLYRVIRAGRDRRFDGMREDFWKFGKFWLGQAVTVWILMIPVTLALSGNGTEHTLAYIGFVVWLCGLIVEAVADLQKYRFTHNPVHKGHWVDTGLWRYSRHPNYFGEILVWLGIYAYALPHLSEAGRVIGIISPVFITALLLFVSGIPILEKTADTRWGKNPAYRNYKNRTSLLIPLPRKRLMSPTE